MFHFLVELGDGRPQRARASSLPWPARAVPGMTPMREPPPSPRQRALIEIAKRYPDTIEMTPDDAVDRQLDMLFGEDAVPMYQWYNLGGKRQLSAYDVTDLEILFFAGQDHEPGGIELHQRGGGCWLRIKHGRTRRVRIALDDKSYRLICAEHYTPHDQRVAHFPA